MLVYRPALFDSKDLRRTLPSVIHPTNLELQNLPTTHPHAEPQAVTTSTRQPPFATIPQPVQHPAGVVVVIQIAQ
jgi:hypothetical protein